MKLGVMAALFNNIGMDRALRKWSDTGEPASDGCDAKQASIFLWARFPDAQPEAAQVGGDVFVERLS